MYQWWNEIGKISIHIFETYVSFSFRSSFQIQKEILQYQKKNKKVPVKYKVAFKYNIAKQQNIRK